MCFREIYIRSLASGFARTNVCFGINFSFAAPPPMMPFLDSFSEEIWLQTYRRLQNLQDAPFLDWQTWAWRFISAAMFFWYISERRPMGEKWRNLKKSRNSRFQERPWLFEINPRVSRRRETEKWKYHMNWEQCDCPKARQKHYKMAPARLIPDSFSVKNHEMI